jgi:hypothetical protein
VPTNGAPRTRAAGRSPSLLRHPACRAGWRLAALSSTAMVLGVPQEDGLGVEGPCVGQCQVAAVPWIGKEARPAAEDDRVDDDPRVVEQPRSLSAPAAVAPPVSKMFLPGRRFNSATSAARFSPITRASQRACPACGRSRPSASAARRAQTSARGRRWWRIGVGGRPVGGHPPPYHPSVQERVDLFVHPLGIGEQLRPDGRPAELAVGSGDVAVDRGVHPVDDLSRDELLSPDGRSRSRVLDVIRADPRAFR